MSSLQSNSEQTILVFNSGSSSFKFSAFNLFTLEVVLQGSATALGTDKAEIHFTSVNNTISLPLTNGDHRLAIQQLVKTLPQFNISLAQVAIAGHRVVHGGEHFQQSALIDETVLANIHACSELAPLHNPANILGIEILQQLCPQLPQAAVFDTAFHQTLPATAFLYPLPYSLYKDYGIRRYGFHGTSHRYVSEQAIKKLDLEPHNHQMLVAHLGNGCSASAIKNGKSVDTTMGLTPLEGAMMGTRSGDVDPGLHQYLQHRLGWSLDYITEMLNRQSGLLGVSGLSNDMRTLFTAADNGNNQAQLAIDVFCFRMARLLGGLATSLDRIDALIFTGGIGEHQATVRQKIVQQLGILGLSMNSVKNAQHGLNSNGIVGGENGPLTAVIATDEERMIAIDCKKLIEEI